MLEALVGDVVVRAAVAAALSLVTVLVAIPRLAAWARRKRYGDRDDKSDSDRLNELHKAKRSTPIVGGIGIVGGTLVASLACASWTSPAVWLLLGTVVGLAGLGLADDLTKTFGRTRTQGLTPRQKLAAQVAVGLGLGGALLGLSGGPHGVDPGVLTSLHVPLAGWALPLTAAGFVAFTSLVVTGSSNAVNLTDGLDGLAGGCSLVALAAYVLVGMTAGDAALAARFGLTHVPGAAEAAVVLAAVAGGVTGFLVYNRHPAQVFMGDTGSLALGGVLGAGAVLTKQELLLVLVGGVFVAEALSVMAQVGCFKLTGRRVLRCAPLHHHFEFKGWQETQIVTRFHAAAIALALLGLAGLGGRS